MKQGPQRAAKAAATDGRLYSFTLTPSNPAFDQHDLSPRTLLPDMRGAVIPSLLPLPNRVTDRQASPFIDRSRGGPF